MNTNNEPAFPDDLNPALVGAIAKFIGQITGLTPPPTDAFPLEWHGFLRELVQSIDAIKADQKTERVLLALDPTKATEVANMRMSYAFLVTADDSLNELSPIEVLHGTVLSDFRSQLEACQQRILDLPLAQRFAKVLALWRMEQAAERDRPLKPSDAGHQVAALIEDLEKRGIFATVERVSVPPFAMGNHVARVKTWRKRERAE
jgi:hypothetical protein